MRLPRGRSCTTRWYVRATYIDQEEMVLNAAACMRSVKWCQGTYRRRDRDSSLQRQRIDLRTEQDADRADSRVIKQAGITVPRITHIIRTH